jgi:hypothetical protein
MLEVALVDPPASSMSLAQQLEDDAPLVRLRSMFKHVQALPGSQSKLARDHWNRQAGIRQRSANVRRHVVRTFHGVPISWSVFRDQ